MNGKLSTDDGMKRERERERETVTFIIYDVHPKAEAIELGLFRTFLNSKLNYLNLATARKQAR